MSWLNLALGLIREAASTEAGQDILNDMRSGSRPENRPNPSEPQSDAEAFEAWMRSVETRLKVAERNAEMLAGMLNAQDEAMTRIRKQQRIWNYAFVAALLIESAGLVWLIFF